MLAVSLVATGVGHFATPRTFESMVPPDLPFGLSPRCATQISGVAELAIAGLLALPRTRRLGGLGAAALFVAVFPANVHMARQSSDRAWPFRLAAYARLPLQLPLILLAAGVARSSAPSP